MDSIKKFGIVIVENEKGEILFGKRKSNNLWTTPAGNIEENETPLMGSIRELKEEVNITAKPTQMKFINEKIVTALDSGERIKLYLYKFKVNSKKINLSSKNDPDAELFNNSLKFFKTPLPNRILENLHVPRKNNVVVEYLRNNTDLDSITTDGANNMDFKDRLGKLRDLVSGKTTAKTESVINGVDVEDEGGLSRELIGEIKETPILKDTLKDISYEMGYQAHQGTSFSPEVRARQEQESYLQTLLDSYKDLSAIAITDEQKEMLEDGFNEFKSGYLKRFTKRLSAKSRIMSVMITGGGNFPVARMEKLNGYERSASEDLYRYIEYKIGKIKSKIQGTDVIKSSDDDAVTKLQAKVDTLTKIQEDMKAINKLIKKGKSASEAVAEVGMSIETTKAYYLESRGFPSFMLTNNNAKIKNTKARVSELEKAKEVKDSGGTADKEYDGLTIHENFNEMRVQLLFDEKPTAESRDILKSNGFRWSGKHGAWQRHLNSNGRYAVKRVIEKLGLDKIESK